jgi:hypothetical protein
MPDELRGFADSLLFTDMGRMYADALPLMSELEQERLGLKLITFFHRRLRRIIDA